MPQHKSAKKRVKTNLKRQVRNRAGRSSLRTTLKNIREMPQEKRVEAMNEIQSILDKAAGRGIIHPNKAARLKSKLSSNE
ncbi:MAG: 30S ribosomal protein S20 [Candidatus Latescibacterota bacterium]|nr:MAG: 30S ribosomal protein S20 [Candidatus Latescibacterota bacterium]